jgi:hypothetical protein
LLGQGRRGWARIVRPCPIVHDVLVGGKGDNGGSAA